MKQAALYRLLSENCLYFSWLISILATGGSLYFSEFLGYIPCKLCWIQRIFMYPLAIMLGIAAYKNDKAIIPYAKTLSIIGAGISIFHYSEQKVPFMHDIVPCTGGVPCSGQYINWLGFITIPFLAFIGFLLITVILFLNQGQQEK